MISGVRGSRVIRLIWDISVIRDIRVLEVSWALSKALRVLESSGTGPVAIE